MYTRGRKEMRRVKEGTSDDMIVKNNIIDFTLLENYTITLATACSYEMYTSAEAKYI